MLNAMIAKTCTKCKIIKSLSEFGKESRSTDGHYSSCKVCHAARVKQYRQTEKGKENHRASSARHSRSEKGKRKRKQYDQSENGKAAKARYNRSENGKEKNRARDARYRHTDGGKLRVQARRAVNEAVRTGQLPPATTLQCTYCEKSAEQYHHHKGYEPEHWLDVIPLCSDCHRIVHYETVSESGESEN